MCVGREVKAGQGGQFNSWRSERGHDHLVQAWLGRSLLAPNPRLHGKDLYLSKWEAATEFTNCRLGPSIMAKGGFNRVGYLFVICVWTETDLALSHCFL